MAYDAVRHQIILFGGGVPNQHDVTYLNTTWTWDGTTWTQRAPPSAPEPRTNAAMAYNSAAQEIILYGGSGQAATFNDLWAWDGITWTQQHSAQIPPARQQGYLVYDDARHQALVFGGIDAIHLQPLDDTWAWDGADWTEVVSQGGPANLYQSAAYDPDHQQVVVYAGQGDPKASPPTVPKSQTWIWDGSTWKRLG
jgi:hypothetical protein